MPEQNPFLGATERAQQAQQPAAVNPFLRATQRAHGSAGMIGGAQAAESHETQLARGDAPNPFTGATQRQRQGQAPKPVPAPAEPNFWENLGTFAKEAIPQAAGGALDALEQAADTMESVLPLGTFELGEGGIRHRAVEPAAERGFPEVAPAETIGGGLVRGVSQFLTGFVPAFRAMRGIGALGGASKAGQFAAQAVRGEAAAQLADQLVFDPHEERLSNLVQEYPALQNPVTEYLAADLADTEAEARLKVALEGLGLGALVGGFTESLRLMRRARKAKGAGAAAETRTEPFLGPESQTPGKPVSRTSESLTGVAESSGPDLSAKARELLERLNPSKPRTLEDIGQESAVEARGLVGADDQLDRLIDVARGTKKPPRKPRTLTQFLHQAGGLKDQGGELRALGITARSRPGFVNNASGLPLDEAGLRATEADFFSERPTVGEFLDALADDINGTAPRLDPADADLADFHDLLGEVDELVSRSNLNLDELSNAEVRAHLQGLANEPAPRTLGDMEREAAQQQEAMTGLEAGPVGSRAGNINLDRINTGMDAKRVLKETADLVSPQIDEARRGVMSEDATRALADDLGMTPERLLKRRRGQAFNAEEALAARGLLTASSEQLGRLAKAALGGSDEALAEVQKAFTRHVAIQEQVAGMTAEAGRALRSFRFTAKSDAAKARALQQIVDSGGGRDGIEDLASKIADIDNPEALNTFTREAFKPTVREKLFELWINALLSGPRTHAVNVLSNTLTSLWTLPEHALASGLGVVRRGGDKVYLRETAHRAFGWAEGLKDGLVYFGKALKSGESGFDDLTKIEARRHRAIGGPIGEVVRLPGRFLQAEDDFFKAIGYRMELRSQALRGGLRKGLKGDDLAQHVDQVLRDPPEDIKIRALDEAHYLTFTKRLGSKGRAVQQLANSIPGGRVILPFIRTPANIIKFAAERSPIAPAFGEVRVAIKAGGAERDLAIARMTLGSGIGAVMASLAAEGQITGGGPSHGQTRNLMRANGWQPYSVKIGDKYYSYGRLEPLGMLMGVSADFAEISGQISEGEADKIGTLIVGSISKNLLSKTWLRGPSELVQALQDPDRYGQRWLLQLAGTAVPTGVAQVGQTLDPVLRSTRPTAVGDPLLAEAQALINKVKSRLPGYSQDLPPVRNVFGEPIIYGGGLGPDLVSPVFMSTDRNDPVIEEMLRLKVTPSMPQRTIGGVKLNPAQYDELVQMAGKPAKALLSQLVASPGFASLPDFAKQRTIRKILNQTREAAREALLAKHPDLLRRSLASKRELVAGR